MPLEGIAGRRLDEVNSIPKTPRLSSKKTSRFAWCVRETLLAIRRGDAACAAATAACAAAMAPSNSQLREELDIVLSSLRSNRARREGVR